MLLAKSRSAHFDGAWQYYNADSTSDFRAFRGQIAGAPREYLIKSGDYTLRTG
jgi:hypothetical protein